MFMRPIPTVKVTYQGKPLTQRFYDAHPEIHCLYPTKKVFLEKIYKSVVQKMQETNTEQMLELSEDKIQLNGEDWLRDSS